MLSHSLWIKIAESKPVAHSLCWQVLGPVSPILYTKFSKSLTTIQSYVFAVLRTLYFREVI